MMRSLVPLAFLTFLFSPAAAQDTQCAPEQTPVLVLGTFHMDNPGLDAHNLEADDVLSARRQKEMAELIEKLLRFKPTKVALEGPRWSQAWNSRYKQFLAGDYELGRNEIEQLGFRIAQRSKIPELSPIDFPMFMGGMLPIERHQPRPQQQAPEPKPDPKPEPKPQPKSEFELLMEKEQRILRESTLSEFLFYVNQPSRYRMNHQWDVMNNLEPGDGIYLYERTDLATNWYKRNLRMFTNLLRAMEPGDRVLLIVGSGHLAILTDLTHEHPRTCLVPATEYLR